MRVGGYRWYHETARSLLTKGARPLSGAIISAIPDGVHEVEVSRVIRGGSRLTVIYKGMANRTFKQEYEVGSVGYRELLRVCHGVRTGARLKIQIVTGGDYDTYVATSGIYFASKRSTGEIVATSSDIRDILKFRPERFVAKHLPIVRNSSSWAVRN